ncbi:LysR family transcriptional regulator [Dietzia cercidiphylli]|uniref:LysR family transcriptional regulator n=1 Tax=Dietzia cercidiphylli TaxID=498199 RepID=UPI00223AE442|nr:LysR family transcriptional regulator [Dietzia cercidiphylli]MCT1515789.1 LysR family transcriptional regulator [Dietzia cercidiphylli]
MAINLGVHHLRAIVAVAHHRSFTLAAAELGVAQSSLSRTVLEAERRLRTPLFQRSTRRVLLTADGEAVVAVARGVIENVDTGLAHIEGYLAGTRGSITIATLPSLAATLLPPVIRGYQRLHPDVSVHVEDNLSDQVAEHLRSGRADLALTTHPGDSPEYVVRPIAEDSFFLAVHPDHRYAGAETVDWSDLQSEPLIAFGPASSVQKAVAAALSDAEVSPATIVRAQNVAAVAGLAASGLGVAPVPGFVLPLMRFAGLTFVPLVPERSRTIALVRHRDRPLSPAVAAWMDVVDRNLGSDPEQLLGVRWIRPDTRPGGGAIS